MASRVRILILDDSHAIVTQLRVLCAAVLDRPEVLAATDLATARARLSERPDIVFIDIRLAHDANGLDLIWDIGRSLPDARIITISGLPATDAMVHAARAVGAHAHIEKPLRHENVRQALGPFVSERAK